MRSSQRRTGCRKKEECYNAGRGELFGFSVPAVSCENRSVEVESDDRIPKSAMMTCTGTGVKKPGLGRGERLQAPPDRTVKPNRASWILTWRLWVLRFAI